MRRAEQLGNVPRRLHENAMTMCRWQCLHCARPNPWTRTPLRYSSNSLYVVGKPAVVLLAGLSEKCFEMLLDDSVEDGVFGL